MANEIQSKKTKGTFYLGAKENEMLMDLYISQLKRYGKGDKSAIICEAIRTLYTGSNNTGK
jgi:hypothetical protein